MRSNIDLWLEVRTVSLSLLCALVLSSCSGSRAPQEAVSQEIQARLTGTGAYSTIIIGNDSIGSSDLLAGLYIDRNHRAFWSTDRDLLPQADSLVEAIKEADREGLRSEDYHLASLEAMMRDFRTHGQDGSFPFAPRLADLDLMLTDAFLLYASHLATGKVDPETLEPRWHPRRDALDYADFMENALRSNRIRESLRGLLPRHAFYAHLRRMLLLFEARAKKGGWEPVPGGPEMKLGGEGQRVSALRRRLAASGDFVERQRRKRTEFDSTLAGAVRRFQKRHGLDATGIVDSTTRAALNVPVEDRVGQIRANLERWRWLPHTLSRKYVAVNVADFRLTAVENGSAVLSMKVVVGNPDWQTPVFSSSLTQVLFNDYWVAPHNILETELINYMKADSEYLRRNKMVLLRQQGDTLQEIDPRSVNLAALDPKDIDFTLRQDPGPLNIMGQVKFLLPNRYEVFLHDTPYREDFAKSIRMYSHGCIRLERPYEFAEYLLKDYPGWTKDTILAVVQRIERRTINLKEPVRIDVLYCTAWRDKDGTIEFREDYYGRDKRLNEALLQGPQATSAQPQVRLRVGRGP